MQIFKIKICLVSFFILPILCHAQQFKERVYLKDTAIFYEGYIIEQAPSKYVKIYRLKEKDTITVLLNNVLKLTKMYVVDTVAAIKTTKLTNTKADRYTKVAFVELGGNGLIYSLNYDMRTARGKRNGWGLRAGVELIKFSQIDTVDGANIKGSFSFFAVPIGLNYLFGKRKSFVELGVGATYFSYTGKATGSASIESYQQETFKETFGAVVGTLNIGYRHVPYKNGFMYRAAFTPLILGNASVIYFGIGLGYHFK